MHVTVTQDDINNGVREDAEKCAIALAIKRICGEGIFVIVENPNVEVEDTTYVLPKNIQEYIDSFDRGDVVNPIEFDMEYEESMFDDSGIIDYL